MALLHSFPLQDKITLQILLQHSAFFSLFSAIVLNFLSAPVIHWQWNFSRFSQFQSRHSFKITETTKQRKYKSVNLRSQHSWPFYVIKLWVTKNHETIKTPFLNFIQCRMNHFSFFSFSIHIKITRDFTIERLSFIEK